MDSLKVENPIESGSELTSIDTYIKNILEEFGKDATMSSNLIEQKIETPLFKMVRELIMNPLKSNVKNYFESEAKILETIRVVFYSFFLKNKDAIDKVFIEYLNDNATCFYIILKDDKDEYKTLLNNFKFSYDKSPMGDKFPIYYQYFPKDLSKEINSISKELRLD